MCPLVLLHWCCSPARLWKEKGLPGGPSVPALLGDSCEELKVGRELASSEESASYKKAVAGKKGPRPAVRREMRIGSLG